MTPPNPFAAALFHRAPIPTSPPNEHRGPKPDLTPTQQEALEKAQDSPLLFLLGAPGTGKSRVTSELVRELLKGQSVLFCCSTRAALENAARDLELDHPALTVGTISGLVRSEKQQAHDTVIVDEAGMVVIANMSHIGIQYPDSAVDRFLSRLLFRADLLDGEDIQKYSRATNTLIDFFHRDCEQLSKQFQSGQHPSEEPTQRVIYNSCDLIQRLIQLCNRIRPRAFDVGVTLNALERPSGALSLCDLSAEHQFEPENAILFRSTVSELYKVIYESTMVSVPGENRNKSPDKPIYDPDADNGESYGRVRLWIRELRNYYQHDHEKPEDYRKGFGKRQRDFLFNNAIGRPAPEESQDSGNLTEDYSRAEYLRVTLFLLREVVIYLEAVRRRLQHS